MLLPLCELIGPWPRTACPCGRAVSWWPGHPTTAPGPAYENATADGDSSVFSTGLSIDSDVDSAVGDIDKPAIRAVKHLRVCRGERADLSQVQAREILDAKRRDRTRTPRPAACYLRASAQGRAAPGSSAGPPARARHIGTGTGIWAIDFATLYPSADVLGTDLSPIQPDFVPPNCHFEIDDAEDEWAYGSDPVFDYVHFRLLWHSFSDPRRVLQPAFDALKPGGYVEWQDYLAHFRAVDDSLQGRELARLDTLYVEAGARLGRDMLLTPKIAGLMRDVGFVDVVEERYALLGSPWPRGRHAKTLGLWQQANFLAGMSAITMAVLTRGLGMTPAEVELQGRLGSRRALLRSRVCHVRPQAIPQRGLR